MFEGFKHLQLQTSEPQVTIHLRYGGTGPGLLLLHGNPLTHVTWHKMAPRLAQNFTVVASDLRGYGDSSKPRGQPDHSTDTFRRMAQDQVEVMEPLGFREFFSAGHDRGARSALRLALDRGLPCGGHAGFRHGHSGLRGGPQGTCPELVLWGDKSHVEQYFNPREAWPLYATNVVQYVVVPRRALPARAGTR